MVATSKLIMLNDRLPYQWKIQSVSKDKIKACIVAYIDARDAASMLDNVCGKDNWQNEYYQAGNIVLCRVGINTENGWIWKSDTGDSHNENEPEKSLASDAFKRACVKWGIGAFLYDLELVWLGYDDTKKKCLDEEGKPIYNLNEYMEKRNKKPVSKSTVDVIKEQFTDDGFKVQAYNALKDKIGVDAITELNLSYGVERFSQLTPGKIRQILAENKINI